MIEPGKPRPRVGLLRPMTKGAEAAGPHTVRARLHYSSPSFLRFVAVDYMKVVPKHVVQRGVDINAWENIVGSGPFKIKAARRGDSVTFERNPGYFKKGRPYLDGLTLVGITVAALRPTLLILDPFVRLHRIDENASAEVAPLLAYLRDLQRHYQLAVVVVHHARKGAARVREGQALRGSSEFHAWGDSNLYLRRHQDQLTLSIEHRAAPSRTGIPLSLRAHADALAREVFDRPVPAALPPSPSGADRVEHALAEATAPISLAVLRRACRIRRATLCAILATLAQAGRIRKTPDGCQLVG
jgi:hypothetical protein